MMEKRPSILWAEEKPDIAGSAIRNFESMAVRKIEHVGIMVTGLEKSNAFT